MWQKYSTIQTLGNTYAAILTPILFITTLVNRGPGPYLRIELWPQIGHSYIFSSNFFSLSIFHRHFLRKSVEKNPASSINDQVLFCKRNLANKMSVASTINRDNTIVSNQAAIIISLSAHPPLFPS